MLDKDPDVEISAIRIFLFPIFSSFLLSDRYGSFDRDRQQPNTQNNHPKVV